MCSHELQLFKLHKSWLLLSLKLLYIKVCFLDLFGNNDGLDMLAVAIYFVVTSTWICLLIFYSKRKKDTRRHNYQPSTKEGF